jgi:hypothetical protein
MLRFPNRTAQSGVYKTGTPNYVDAFGGTAVTGMVTFATKVVGDGWNDGDTVGVLVKKDDSNYWVGLGTWDATNNYVELTTEEESIGTLADGDPITISAVPTASTFLAVARGAEFVEESGATRTLSLTDEGATIRCTSGSAVAITCADTLPVGFHCLIVQEGAGTVTIDSENTHSLNGATAGTGVEVAGQWKSAYVYQRAEGEWVVVA